MNAPSRLLTNGPATKIAALICASTTMPKCTSCAHENPTGARFCAQCGVRLAQVCHACGEAVIAAQRFCSACGQLGTSIVSELISRKILWVSSIHFAKKAAHMTCGVARMKPCAA